MQTDTFTKWMLGITAAVVVAMGSALFSTVLALREDMAAQHAVEKKKIEELNRWRWFVLGGAAVVGWILSKMGLPFEIK